MPKAKSKAERPVRGGRPRINDACRKQVVELYNKDFLVAEIAKRCNVSESSVYRIIRTAREVKTV
jgi:transposase